MDVGGKNVLITGGAKGIGSTLAQHLLRSGATVGVFDVDRAAMQALSDAHPDVYVAACDVSHPASVQAEVENFVARHKKIHVLVNNAGLVVNSPLIRFGEGALVRHDIELWDRVIRTDLSAAFYVTAHVVENMVLTRTRGVVINISSVAAAGNAGQGAYSAAKAGLNALTVAWAKELAPMRIRFVAVAPGFTQTDTTVRAVEPVVLDGWVKQTPARRLGTPDEIAEAIMFAINNDFLNGAVLAVDGGLRL